MPVELARGTALVWGDGPAVTQLAGRTVRSVRAAGWTVEDLTGQPATELMTRLARAAGPVWLLQAGAWLPTLRAVTPPPASAHGQPLCAIGWPLPALASVAHNVPAADGEPTSDDAPPRPFAAWRRLYAEAGGDLSVLVAAGREIPCPLSVLLEPGLAHAIARRWKQQSVACGPMIGPALGTLLLEEIRAGHYRCVRYAPLDVQFDARLRVLQMVTSLQRGGAERVTVDLVRHLAATGTHCRVMTIGSPTRAPFPAPPGTCDLSTLPRDRATRVAAAIRLALIDGGDVVHAHLLDRTDLAQVAAAGLPVLSTVHNTRPGWQAGQGDLQPGECDLVVGCAQVVTSELAGAGLPLPLRTVWNGIPLAEFSRRRGDPVLRKRLRRKWGLGPQDLVLLALANPRPQKRLPLLPAILDAVRERWRQTGRGTTVRLLLAGEAAQVHPTARQAVKATNAAARRLGVDKLVTWLGAVQDVGALLAAADVLVSASAHEGLSLAYIEALAAGVPVVATDVGGTREVAAPGVPLRLLSVEAPAADFASAVVDSVLAPAGPAPSLADFSLERMAERYRWLYPRVVAARRGRVSPRPRPERLWLITNNFSTGGAQSSARRLLTGLAAQGVAVRAAVLQEDPDHPTPGLLALRAAGVPVEILPPAGTVDSAAAAARLLDLIDADQPRSVLFWNVIPEYKLLLADGLLGVRVYDISPGEMYFASLARYFARPRPGLPYRTAAEYGGRLHGVIVKYQAEAATARALLGVPVHVIPNGVPIGDPIRPAPGARPLVIGTAARISPQKRLEDLIASLRRAHDRLPDYTLRIAGAPETGAEDYAQELRRAAAGLPVEWLGDVADVPGFLRGLDLFVQISEPAGCPNASLEALAAGLPIVATDVGGASEQVLDGVTGRLVPPRDPGAFASAVVDLSHNGLLRAQLSAAATAHARCQFSLERMLADYRRVCLEDCPGT